MNKDKTYLFQLEQVERKLLSHPSDPSLLLLKEKLNRLIALNTKLSDAAKNDPLLDKPTTLTTNKDPSTKPPQVQIGHLCEAKYEGKWYEAIVQSIAQAGESYTVLFTGSSETQHCDADEIRPIDTKRASKKRHVTEASASSSSPRFGSNPPKKKPSRSEFIQQKEEEHKEKQESWQKFRQNMNRTGMFKRT